MRGWVKGVLVGVVVVAVAVASVAAWGYWRLSSNLTVVDIDGALGSDRPPRLPMPQPVETYRDPAPVPSQSEAAAWEPPTRVLVLGSDSRQGAVNSLYGDPSVYSNSRSDVAMLLQLAPDRTWAEVVAVPRDLVVSIPTSRKVCGDWGYDASTRFNAAFQYGGPACTVATFEALTGVRVDHTVVVDFAGFTAMVDALGGLNVCLNYPVVDEDAKLNLPAGKQTLTGVQALSLARARKSLGTGSDVSRIARQQFLIRLLAGQVQAANVFTDSTRLFAVASAATESLTLSSSLGSLPDLARLGSQLAALDPDRVVTVTVPWVPDPAAPLSTVVLDEPAAGVLFERLARGEPPRLPGDGRGGPDRARDRPAGPKPSDEASVRSLFCRL